MSVSVSNVLPELTGTNGNNAVQEIHIFLKDLNPTPETLQLYNAVVDEWNSLHPNTADKMKACFLALVFRDPEGKENVVKVMQSARYLRCNSTAETVEEGHADAKWFEDHGLAVIREKIEATAFGINQIPLTLDALPSGKYFEFHIKVGRKDREKTCPIEPDEIDILQAISLQFSQQFRIPVPLSYNENKNKFNDDGEGHQRFLNVRFRCGRDAAVQCVKAIESAINEQTPFKVLKTISEYVWFDTLPELDRGWIDYSPEELTKMYGT